MLPMGATKGAAYTPNETFPPKFQELKFLTADRELHGLMVYMYQAFDILFFHF